MAIVIKAHYDGKVIVPDEPVDLPVGEPIEAELRVPSLRHDRRAQTQAEWEEFSACVVDGLRLPEDAFRRENLYEDPT